MKPLILLSTLFLFACASGNCRAKKEIAEEMQKTQTVTAESEVAMLKKIKVYKYDGSLQCGMGKAIAVKDMEKQLKGVHVYSRESKSDGLMRIQVCGSPTGKANVYEIDEASQAKALSLGFQVWNFN